MSRIIYDDPDIQEAADEYHDGDDGIDDAMWLEAEDAEELFGDDDAV